jgi:hypothetical protein
MNLKYLAFVFAVLSITYTNAQTKPKPRTSTQPTKPSKEETITWLTEKLNKYCIFKQDAMIRYKAIHDWTSTYLNSISIDDCNIYLNYTIEIEATSRKYYKYTDAVIPISDIDISAVAKVASYTTTDKAIITIKTNSRSITATVKQKEWERDWSVEEPFFGWKEPPKVTSGIEETYNTTYIVFNFYKEDDLLDRFYTAIGNLQSYCPKYEKKKETF